MRLSGLVDLLSEDPGVASAIEDARGRVPAFDLTAPPAVRPVLIAALAKGTGRPILLVTSTFREAEAVTSALGVVLGEDDVCYYPAWETLPHERLSPRADTVGRRLGVLRRIAGVDELPPPAVVVAPVRSLLQPQVKDLAQLRPVRLQAGADYDMTQLAQDLVAAAYQRVDLVQRRGEFAVRGGIVDVFPPTEPHPARVEFFGDQIDEIRPFTVADQRSSDTQLTEVVAAPCRELLITPEVQTRATQLLPDHPELAEMLEKIAQGQAVEGMEALIPALVDQLELLIDVLPSDTLVLVADPELVRGRSGELVATSQEFLHASWAAAASGGRAPIDLGASAYWELREVRSHALARGQGWWTLSQLSSADGDSALTRDPEPASARDPESVPAPDAKPASARDAKHVSAGSEGTAPAESDALASDVDGVASATLTITGQGSWRGDTEAAIASMGDDVTAGWRVVLGVEGHGRASRMAEVLRDHELGHRVSEELPDTPPTGIVTILTPGLPHGFRAPGVRLAVYSAEDISGQQEADRSQRRMPARRRNQVVPLELRPGDPLVHEQHGVGRFVELTQRTVAGSTREYLVVEYAPSKRGQPGDRLYVPMDSLDQITRYVGGEAPQLDRMGGADWRARKSRARRAVHQIAAELIKLYAARQATRGHAFPPDTPWQREMEDAFSYIETPDQLACINDVKHDMEQIVPMDRLVSGDVGYGKTEIAVRAAFKAVQDGKQVAVLVPTTLLVQQHTQTFTDRYAGFPVVVEPLSRFQTPAEAKRTIEGLASGRVDVVIGTHRLLSDGIHFKDLGLVVIDEEQRFGVEHKEALKRLRVNVDVLSMSATPIPRTLEMAVTGIREMSTIATPPEERHPVLTFAGPYDEGQVVAAVRRELAREGQVFFIHNRVQTIERAAARLRELVPEARIVTAHGQMSEKKLEQVMFDFWQREADVLVCTTIVEAGLDIASANTLIVDRADHMGLSQLHQLRGRVGRSRERGYAYFLYPPETPLSQTAHDRLAALAANNELGAGMAIAMKDLEIRGAGNLLGEEQSGHIADVGFDLYLRLVGEAVADYRGDVTEEEAPEMRIELPVDAHLPVDYIESERLRLEMYKRIAEVRDQADIDAVRAEMTDRYGPPPPPASRLLDVADFRLTCRAAGLTEVVSQGRYIRFAPASGRRLPDGGAVDLPESRQLRLTRLHPGSLIKQAASQVLVPRPTAGGLGSPPLTDENLLEWAARLVRDIFLPPAPIGSTATAAAEVAATAQR